MKELKCRQCGAIMSLDEDKEFATCKYCGAKYKLNEDKNINIKLDEGTKDVLNNGLKTFGKIWTFSAIPFVLVFIVVFIITGVVIFNIINFDKEDSPTKVDNNISDTIKENVNNLEETVKEQITKQEIDSFNGSFEFYAGTKWKNSIESLLDKVIKNNRKNSDKLISVIYNDKNTTDANEIINIKHSLEDFKDYEVKVDYNDQGLVNRVIIEDI